MKRLCVPVMAIAVACVLGGSALAASSATQTVTYQVSAIHEISISGNPPPFTFNSATAGSDLGNQTVVNAGFYDITNNEANCKITGQLDSDMPTGMTLKVDMNAPGSGTSASTVALSSTAADLVIGIGSVDFNACNIAIEVDASVTAGVVSSTQRVITYTLLQ